MATIPVVSLLEQVRQTWEERCRRADKELVVENELEPDAALVTDVQLLMQVLGNLIDNACKYSQGAADRRVVLRTSPSGQRRLALEVADGGGGVPPGARQSIFRPFRRGHDKYATVGGVGLGLALARRWTQLLGGKLSLVAAPGSAGACFRLDLATSNGQEPVRKP
jgi:signal transduction histidine kinase